MYSIQVKIDGFENRRRSAGLLHIFIGFFLILKSFDYYNFSEKPSVFSVLPVLIVSAASLYYGLFRKRIDPAGKNNPWLRLLQVVTFIIFALAMARVGKEIDYYSLFLWAVLTLIMMLTERKIFQETVIFMDENGVKIPGYYKDHLLRWEELGSVVVRHDFITFFHRNNKYQQYQVMQTLSELELAKMNAFSKEQLQKSQTVNSEN